MIRILFISLLCAVYILFLCVYNLFCWSSRFIQNRKKHIKWEKKILSMFIHCTPFTFLIPLSLVHHERTKFSASNREKKWVYLRTFACYKIVTVSVGSVRLIQDIWLERESGKKEIAWIRAKICCDRSATECITRNVVDIHFWVRRLHFVSLMVTRFSVFFFNTFYFRQIPHLIYLDGGFYKTFVCIPSIVYKTVFNGKVNSH